MINVSKQVPLGKLSIEQRKRFAELRRLIEAKWTEAVVEVGKALWEIRDGKLYREDFDRFEDFCRVTFDLSRGRAYQLIDHAKVNENLSTVVDKPVREAVARELKRVEPEKQAEVYKEVKKHSPKPTAKTVRAVIDKSVEVNFDDIQIPERYADALKPSSSFEQGFKFLMMQGVKKLELDFERYRVVIIPKP